MKLKPEIWVIILGVALVALTIFTVTDKINSNAELKSLKKSHELLDKKLELQKKNNENKILELQEVIHWQDEHVADLRQGLQQIENTIDNINTQADEKKAHIDNVTDADILTDILTKRYR